MTSALAPFWVVPALWCLGAVVLGLVLPELDEVLAPSMPLLFQAGPDGARTFLSTIAGAMISVTGLVFSVTMVVLQLASSQFTPRVLRTFLDERVPQHTLGVFMASFLYALAVLRSIYGSSDQVGGDPVPQMSISLAFVLVLASAGMFLAFIHHITEAISVEHVVGQVGADLRRLTTQMVTERETMSEREVLLPDLPGSSVVVTAARSGNLNYIDHPGLLQLASHEDVRIQLLHPLGTFLPAGAPIATVAGGRREEGGIDWQQAIAAQDWLIHRRSSEQDLSFGLRQLVDIAERALSPGINDPTTATQCIDEIHDVLRRIVALPDASQARTDEHGTARVVLSELSCAQLLDLAVDEIAHWGADSIQVPRRLTVMLDDLAAVATPEHRAAIETKRAHVTRTDRQVEQR